MTQAQPAVERNNLPTTADVVIIGGGPAGTAALWALNKMEPRLRVVLLEQHDRLGAGSSSASLENFRSAWPTPCLARQMARSIQVFLNADETIGDGAAQSIHVQQHGYLFCAFNQTQAAAMQADVGHLHTLGLTHIEYLDAGEVAYRFGWVGPHVIAAKYDPLAGWLDSNGLIHAYARSSPNATIIYDVAGVQLCTSNSRVVGVNTSKGTVATTRVIIAAGANARQIGRTAGVELPVMLRPRQSFTTGWRHTPFPPHSPMLIGAAPFPHVRPEAGSGAIFGWEYTWHNKGLADQHGSNPNHDAIIEPVYPLEPLKDPRFPSLTLALLARQFGHADGEGFADGRYLRGLSHNIGYYVSRNEIAAYTIDADGSRHGYESERAIIDAHPEVDGLFLSIAHVGHGIMSSPAAGEIVASLVLGQSLPDPSYSCFGLDVHWVEYDESVL